MQGRSDALIFQFVAARTVYYSKCDPKFCLVEFVSLFDLNHYLLTNKC